MTSNVHQILGEFIDAWKAGARPDVEDYLARAGSEADRDELADQLATWLTVAPTPDYDEPARAAIAQEPGLRAALDAVALLELSLAQRLPALRERAGLAVRDVARRLVAVFEVGDEGRAASYLDRVERDELDESRLSRRLLDALAAILGADRELLAPGPPALAAGMPGGQVFLRADGNPEQWLAEEFDALSRAAFAPAPAPSVPPAAPAAAAAPPPAPPMDELDRLFLGGPDA